MGKYKQAYNYLMNLLIDFDAVVSVSGTGVYTADKLRQEGYDVAQVFPEGELWPKVDRKVKSIGSRVKNDR